MRASAVGISIRVPINEALWPTAATFWIGPTLDTICAYESARDSTSSKPPKSSAFCPVAEMMFLVRPLGQSLASDFPANVQELVV